MVALLMSWRNVCQKNLGSFLPVVTKCCIFACTESSIIRLFLVSRKFPRSISTVIVRNSRSMIIDGLKRLLDCALESWSAWMTSLQITWVGRLSHRSSYVTQHQLAKSWNQRIYGQPIKGRLTALYMM